MNPLVIYTCSSSVCNRFMLSLPQLAVIGVAAFLILVVCYLIISFEKLNIQPTIPVLATSPDQETEFLRQQYSLEEYQSFLNWQMQMGIISFTEYDDLYTKALPYLK